MDVLWEGQNTKDLTLALSKPPAMFMSHHYVKASEAAAVKKNYMSHCVRSNPTAEQQLQKSNNASDKALSSSPRRIATGSWTRVFSESPEAQDIAGLAP